MSSELFGLLFKQKLSRELAGFEKKRKQVLNKFIFFIFVQIITFFPWGVFDQKLALLSITINLISIFVIWLGFKSLQKWREDFKKKVIPNVLQVLDPNLGFQNSKDFDKNIIKKSELVGGYFNDIQAYCDDYISSKVYGKVRIADLKIYEQYSTNKIFGGVLFAAEFPIRFHGRSFAFHKSFTGLKNLEGLEKVVLESPRLMEKFNFWTTNQVEARMCFQTDIMSNIIDLCEQYGTNFDLSFIDNTIYIALHQSQSFFEPNIFQSVLDPKIYQKFYDEIITLNQIITKFKLQQNL